MTIWRTKTAGMPDTCTYDVSDEFGVPAVIIADYPDWVRRPDTGERLRVMEAVIRRTKCPSCAAEISCRVLVLEQEIELIECPACHQFVFYRR